MRILIIDDDPDTQVLLRRLLRSEGAQIDSRIDGVAGIRALASATYDVVLLDLMLPKANGFQVAAAIERTRPQPRLIVISAVARHFHDRFPVGTVTLQKPFEMERLPTILKELARPVRSAGGMQREKELRPQA